jgi:hypothetical protein
MLAPVLLGALQPVETFGYRLIVVVGWFNIVFGFRFSVKRFSIINELAIRLGTATETELGIIGICFLFSVFGYSLLAFSAHCSLLTDH